NPLQIKGFTIFHEDQIIPYQLKATECEDCELKDSNFYKDGYGDFVFLFEITFKPGLNTINHSFNFPKDGGIDIYANYNYMLTHGENWGDGNIKHMTINIDMGPNQYFFISDIFGKTADWSIIGTGKLTNESSSYFTEFPYKFIRILSGKLQITTSNFKADSNLDFGMFSQYFFTSSIGGYYREEALLFYKDYYGDEEFTKNELRILRNTIYAQHGYVFKSADLKKHFKQFAWYMPNPNLKMEDIILTKTEEIIVNKLLELEK
ncbi:MAG: YARHG domain-containing protein, partial [Xanthomarina sp.]